MNSIGTDVPLNSGGSGRNGAVDSIALIAAWSAKGTPEDFVILRDNNLPSFPIVKVIITRFELSPFGGDQFLLILCSKSRMYGPQFGCLNASIPGVPFGFPGLGFPPDPYPPEPRAAYFDPVEPLDPAEPLEPPEAVENLGVGEYVPLCAPCCEPVDVAGRYVDPTGA